MSQIEDLVWDDWAISQFWETPELVERVLPYLDLTSTKMLAKAHKLTRLILKRAFAWHKLVRRVMPENEKSELCSDVFGLPLSFENDPVLASERQLAKDLVELLRLVKGNSKLAISLLHALCQRHQFWSRAHVQIRCSCLQTHRVTPWAFMLLMEVEASMKRTLFEVDTIQAVPLKGPFLLALAWKVAGQPGMIKMLDVGSFVVEIFSQQSFTENCNDSAEAIAILVEQSEAVAEQKVRIGVEGIGVDGWVAVRRAVQCLWTMFGTNVILSTDPRTMGAGRYEDLKATWDNVWEWLVHDESYGGAFVFSKEQDGEEGWWDRGGFRRGLEAFIDMTEEEWREEGGAFEPAFEGDVGAPEP